jgi:ATP-dependent DNA helicase RecG
MGVFLSWIPAFAGMTTICQVARFPVDDSCESAHFIVTSFSMSTVRPPLLFPLFADVQTLSGVGERNRALLAKFLGTRVLDVLFHLPVGVIDRTQNPDFTLAQSGQTITTLVQVDKHFPPDYKPGSKMPYKVRCYNDSGFLFVNFFHANDHYIKQQLPQGKMRVISGKVERFNNQLSMSHPDYITAPEQYDAVSKIEPVYPLSAGITNKLLQKLTAQALDFLPDMPEWQEVFTVKKNQWKSFKGALFELHTPSDTKATALLSPARKRLAYDELLAHQLALMLHRQKITKEAGQSIHGDGHLQAGLRQVLGFTLTQGQEAVIAEIAEDQRSEHRMLRLLQGDVGSGKTVVALMAMLHAVEAGKQAALMAPTEILARQHATWIERMCRPLGVRVALLTGKSAAQERTAILEGLLTGEIQILIGTHALFQDTVEFRDLGLAIIDEQHRFGVEQRMRLANKGQGTDLLLMTATPIPRTLTMACFGDMECSRLTDKPASRKPIDTRALPLSRMEEVLEGIRRKIEAKEKVYWICPLVEESEKSDLAAAEARYREFVQIFGKQRVGLVHGQMKTEERNRTMLAFRDGEVDILVATTVIEVGVDVPTATVIVIEHAERFGLSQLHQLRGRVGRGDKASSCILLYQHPMGKISTERIKTMRESNDGFFIAEEDLRLRGSGDLLGTKQSGLPNFHIADIFEHQDLLQLATQDAKLALHQDPDLTSERGERLKVLLHLFGYGNVGS